MKLEFEQAKVIQEFESLSTIVGSIFGEGDTNQSSAPRNFMEAEAQFRGLFN